MPDFNPVSRADVYPGQRPSARMFNEMKAALLSQLQGAGGLSVTKIGNRATIINDETQALPISLPVQVVRAFVVKTVDYDTLECVPFIYDTVTPQIYDPNLADELISGDQEATLFTVAKPYILQRDPWDGQSITLAAITYTFAQTGPSERTISWIDDDGAHTLTETINDPYFPGDVILAVDLGTTGIVDPLQSLRDLDILAVSYAGGMGTITFSSTHDCTIGDIIIVSDATNSAYNGTYTVTGIPDNLSIHFDTTATPDPGSDWAAGASAQVLVSTNGVNWEDLNQAGRRWSSYDLFGTFNGSAIIGSTDTLTIQAGAMVILAGCGINITADVLITISTGKTLKVTGGSLDLTGTTVTGSVSIGTIDSGVPSTDGASVVGSTVYLQSADTTVPGLVNTTVQFWSGFKDFGDGIGLSNPVDGLTDSNGSAGGNYTFLKSTPSSGVVWADVNDTLALLTWKPWCKAVATTNVSLSFPGTIDGVTFIAGDQILLTGQTTGHENGPWVVTSLLQLVRPSWYATGNTGQAFPNVTIGITSGMVYGNSIWRCSTTTTINIDTTATTWVRVITSGVPSTPQSLSSLWG